MLYVIFGFQETMNNPAHLPLFWNENNQEWGLLNDATMYRPGQLGELALALPGALWVLLPELHLF